MTRSLDSLERARLSREARARIKAKVDEEVAALSLGGLRRSLEVTQEELSRSSSMTQSELSRIERRGDHRTSTLRRYVEALGGELEISAVIGGKRVKITDA